MARRVRKQCPSCQQLFVGRRDAKTCSERCRKRLQRARLSMARTAALAIEPSVLVDDFSEIDEHAIKLNLRRGGGMS